MKDCRVFPPLRIDRAEGFKLYDDSGKSYYDTISSWWCNVHGHCHPAITEAVSSAIKRLDHVLFAGFTHSPAEELTDKLVGMTPGGLTRVFFSDDGSTAVEVALKMSCQFWKNRGVNGKKLFIGFDKGYHGDTIGAMSVSGPGPYNEKFRDLMFDTLSIPVPSVFKGMEPEECERAEEKSAQLLEDMLRKQSGNIAGIIVEPLLLGAGGMLTYRSSFLKHIEKLARRYGVHLILDEVATGFGRTGRMFACENAGVEPDLMCLSKGITGGVLPLAATIATEEIFGSFLGDALDRTFFHGHTYTANPVACSAANASIDLFGKEGILDNVRMIERKLGAFLDEISGIPVVRKPRNLGVMAAFDLDARKSGDAALRESRRPGYFLYQRGLGYGLILRPLGNTVYLFLPPAMPEQELDEVLRRTVDLIKSVE
jgi:adenosylmethionine-8-amino-7-oxononanoate aminotransferase